MVHLAPARWSVERRYRYKYSDDQTFHFLRTSTHHHSQFHTARSRRGSGNNMVQLSTLVLLPLLVLVPAALGQDFTELDWDAESRQLQIQNVSLVITYTGVVVAALMMAGFLYIALNYGRGRSGYGYGYYAEDDYYDGYHYQKRALHDKQDTPQFLSELFSQLNKFDNQEEED